MKRFPSPNNKSAEVFQSQMNQWLQEKDLCNDGVMFAFFPYLLKLSYDFVSQMAFFEEMQNRRNAAYNELVCVKTQEELEQFKAMHPKLLTEFPSLNRFDLEKLEQTVTRELDKKYNNKPTPITDDMRKKKRDGLIELYLMHDQHLGIYQQLSWLGKNFTSASDPINPIMPDHWYSEQLGIRERQQNKMLEFLKDKQVLDEKQKDELQKLYRSYIRNVKPYHRNSRSEGGITAINESLREIGYPYKLIYKRSNMGGWILKPCNWREEPAPKPRKKKGKKEETEDSK